MMTPEWIEKSIQEHGYTATCGKYSEYALSGCYRICTPETFGRLCRKVRQKLEGTRQPKTPYDVETPLQATDFHKVDLGKYDITRVRVNTWGSDNNQNKQVRLDLKHKGNVIDMVELIEDFKKEVLDHFPQMPVTPEKRNGGSLLELAIPDLHFGLLAWDKQTGHNYNIKLARQAYIQAVDTMLEWASFCSQIDRILLVLGNDFFNSDTPENTTAKGTHQDEDARFQKSFTEGWKAARDAIDLCLTVAPVDVVIVRGNHDTQRAYFLGEVIGAWYEGNNNVSVDNDPNDYKAYVFGKNFIGLTHGHLCKHEKLPGIFATDFPKQWGQTIHRVAHVGHRHVNSVQEYPGLTVEIIPSLGAPSAWTASMGYRSARQAHAYLWDTLRGNQHIFKYRPEILQ